MMQPDAGPVTKNEESHVEKKRKNNPRYLVYKAQEVTTATDANPRVALIPIGAGTDMAVKAQTRKAAVGVAVEKANAAMEKERSVVAESDKHTADGTFMVVPADAVWIGTRTTEKVEQENWS